MSPFIRNYRYLIFFITLAYWLDLYYLNGFSILRYLTNWALTLSVICAGLLSLESAIEKPLRINSFIIAAFCTNVVVMVLYWKLYFKNPDLLYAGSTRMPWYRDDFVHLFCPLAQMFDAIVFKQAFSNKVFKGGLYFLIIATLYTLLSEFVFTLPYPFLWDLDLGQRIYFYTSANVTGILSLLVGLGLSVLFKKVGLIQYFHPLKIN